MFIVYLLAKRELINHMKFACGIDEAGRGALAGPLVVASVVFKNYKDIPKNIKDSKQTSHIFRKRVFSLILNNAYTGIGYVDANIIDKIGITKATEIATDKSILNNKGKKDILLLDGNINSKSNWKKLNIIKGDSNYVSIAAASIVAKFVRDNIMVLKSAKHPHYHWQKNKGYGTKDHLLAIKLYGITEFHRKSYSMGFK